MTMSYDHRSVGRAQDRIRHEMNKLRSEANSLDADAFDVKDAEQAISLRAVADGLEQALEIIDQEVSE
jgi:hypothetical protein